MMKILVVLMCLLVPFETVADPLQPNLADTETLHPERYGTPVSAVGVTSNGFSDVKPLGWLVIIAAPIAAYFGILAARPFLRKAPKDVRLMLGANLLWVLLVGTWGYIWEWEDTFTFERYVAFFILPSIIGWTSFLLWKWYRAG